jgi:hypothetical protein
MASKLQKATSLTIRVLQEITDDFSEERKIGQGAYGKVYKVRLTACLVNLSPMNLYAVNKIVCASLSSNPSNTLLAAQKSTCMMQDSHKLHIFP